MLDEMHVRLLTSMDFEKKDGLTIKGNMGCRRKINDTQI